MRGRENSWRRCDSFSPSLLTCSYSACSCALFPSASESHLVAMPALDDPAAHLARLEPLHSSAVARRQRVAAERAETEDAFGAEEQAQRDAIEETMTPVLEMAQELEELGKEMKDAEAGVFQMLRDNGVSGP